MIILSVKNLFFILKINQDKSTYCVHCFEQLLNLDYSNFEYLTSGHDKYDYLKRNFISKIKENQYGVYDETKKSFEVINIYKVPGCLGKKHGNISC
ncbi:hypothetical protein SAMN02910293_00343 [Streptococcus henryi]|uniref:Uncharacterized protein n=1 Tax=Streptococcus henryi TaxID=439219 RepID=A0A1G6AG10_9STRE|nr:hypothetical protein [Streptococcus henryi]SDB07033.1 hypothetical protein SAMN02910293_00343 [Streptococcus henryi]